MSGLFPVRPRLLLGPGPSPVHERILQALARPDRSRTTTAGPGAEVPHFVTEPAARTRTLAGSAEGSSESVPLPP
ncbi:MAG TPA: hypothetical protein DEP84_37085 [Chloroflexi bacterium]|nr:hypothetical protein [Chloroflexota bacterium]